MTGLLLAAGSGRRYGAPKAMVDTGDGPWVVRALGTLDGCDQRIVVVGAAADEVRAVVAQRALVVLNAEHRSGMASSLRSGLLAVGPVDAVLITLVDLPDVTDAVTRRLIGAIGPSPRSALLRATFHGRPGHPVVIGAEHVPALCAALAAGEPDSGGGDYLRAHGVIPIECGDLAEGIDIDRPGTTPVTPDR